MKKMTFEEFRQKIISLPDDETIWRMKCKNEDGVDYTLSFAKHRFEAEDGQTYPFVVYSYPMTLDASIINERVDDGWDEDIRGAWEDMLNCGLTPMKD